MVKKGAFRDAYYGSDDALRELAADTGRFVLPPKQQAAFSAQPRRSVRAGICVFFATIPVFLESVTVQGGFFAAMSRNDNSGGANGAEANTNANSVVSGRHHLYCDCSGGSRSR